MPIFHDSLTVKNYKLHNGSIDEHLAHIRSVFATIFDGKPFHPYLQNAVKRADAVQSGVARLVPGTADSFGATFGGNGASVRNKFIDAVEVALQEALSGLEPLPLLGPVISTYPALIAAGSVIFTNFSLRAKISQAHEKKIASIYDYGTTYSGHGPTTALGNGVLHAHVGNGTGVAFSWNNAVLTVHAVGTKSDSAGKGNSGYAWIRS